jgi:hypothetical protein
LRWTFIATEPNGFREGVAETTAARFKGRSFLKAVLLALRKLMVAGPTVRRRRRGGDLQVDDPLNPGKVPIWRVGVLSEIRTMAPLVQRTGTSVRRHRARNTANGMRPGNLL